MSSISKEQYDELQNLIKEHNNRVYLQLLKDKKEHEEGQKYLKENEFYKICNDLKKYCPIEYQKSKEFDFSYDTIKEEMSFIIWKNWDDEHEEIPYKLHLQKFVGDYILRVIMKGVEFTPYGENVIELFS